MTSPKIDIEILLELLEHKGKKAFIYAIYPDGQHGCWCATHLRFRCETCEADDHETHE